MDYLHHFDFLFLYKGKQFHIRPISRLDKNKFQKGFSELSEKSKYLRFFSIQNKLSNSQLDYLTKVDGFNHVAIGILDESQHETKPVGVGRFVKLENEPDTAEVAITIVDSYQRKGLAKVLFATLHLFAAKVGIKKFRCYILENNTYVLEMINKMETITQVKENQLFTIDIKVYPNHQAISPNSENQSFIKIMKKVETLTRIY